MIWLDDLQTYRAHMAADVITGDDGTLIDCRNTTTKRTQEQMQKDVVDAALGKRRR